MSNIKIFNPTLVGIDSNIMCVYIIYEGRKYIHESHILKLESELAQAKDKIEKLKAELKQVIEIGVEGQREINRKAHAEIEKLKKQNETMKKALEIIANNEDINCVRNILALMAEDEGTNTSVYQAMSRAALNRLDKALQ